MRVCVCVTEVKTLVSSSEATGGREIILFLTSPCRWQPSARASQKCTIIINLFVFHYLTSKDKREKGRGRETEGEKAGWEKSEFEMKDKSKE